MKEKLLLIAEKPSLMRELKQVYDKHKNEIPYQIDFMALAGHVCMYAAPSDYPEWDKKWIDLESSLPMVPEKWNILVMKDKKDLVKEIQNKISTHSYDGIVCATDADREGNLIYYLLASKLNLKMKTYRFWVHDLTEKEILKSYQNMVDWHKDAFQQNLTHASILRSRFDWLIGMNYTVAATLKSGSLMKIGRVKSPTLKIVYDNSMAIDRFVPETTFGITATYSEGFSGQMFDETGEVFFKTASEAKNMIGSLENKAKVTSIEKKTVKTQAPSLFKLSDLQVHASKAYGYTAEETLAAAQGLYEKKILSYPRCDCRFVSTESAKDFPDILSSLRVFSEFEPFIRRISDKEILAVKNNKKYTNDKEVNESSHTALIPTGEPIDMKSLNEKEINILKTVAARFVSIFLPPLVEEKTVLIAENNGKLFKTNGKVVTDRGYTALYGKKTEDNEIPKHIKPNDFLNVSELSVREKTTTPPERLTEGSLIAAMENISKYIEDNNLKAIMKEAKGIGTPSSRGAIISGLIQDGYIDVKGNKKAKGLYISEKGKQYIENMIDFEILSPELTAVWEDKLRQIERGEIDAAAFSKEMINFVIESMKQIRQTKMSKSALFAAKESLGKCPRCGCDVVETAKAFSCTGYKNDPPCKFAIWKDNKLLAASKKKVTPAMVKKLLAGKKHRVSGLISKTGNKYDAEFSLEDTGTYANLKMEFVSKGVKNHDKKRTD